MVVTQHNADTMRIIWEKLIVLTMLHILMDKVCEESPQRFVPNGQCMGGEIRYTKGVADLMSLAKGNR